jgi:hypothetical protein
MSTIPKFCHNEECGYVCTSDTELDCYAHADGFCPSCQKMDSYKEGDIPILKSEVPTYIYNGLITSWWKAHHAAKKASV